MATAQRDTAGSPQPPATTPRAGGLRLRSGARRESPLSFPEKDAPFNQRDQSQSALYPAGHANWAATALPGSTRVPEPMRRQPATPLLCACAGVAPPFRSRPLSFCACAGMPPLCACA
jgi:hypothetical protein